MIDPNKKPSSNPKQDRYQKFNKTSLLLRQSSFMSSSIQTSATIPVQVVNKDEPKQCRICLHEEDRSTENQLFSPCRCTGSVKYLHRRCFVEWVNKTMELKTPHQKNIIIAQGTQCELCQFLIPIKGEIQSHCSSSPTIKMRIKKRPILFSVFTVIEVLCIVVSAFVVNMMFRMGIGFDDLAIINSVILICSLGVSIALSFGMGYFYINEYFMTQRFVVTGFDDSNKSPNPEVDVARNYNIIHINNSIANLDGD